MCPEIQLRHDMNALTRRKVLHSAAAGFIAGAASVPRLTTSAAGASADAAITDTNTYLGRWPIRHLPLAESAALAAKLKSQGVTEAWAGSFDALLHKDLAGVNARTAETCARHPLFKPVGAVNPSLPRWEDDVERCAKQHRMRGIRLHPNHHGYKLDDPRFHELLKLATSLRLFVQIACLMEDERTQHPLLRVAPVEVSPLPDALDAAPGARIMLLNWQRSSGGKPTLLTLKSTNVMFDVAMVEQIMGIETLIGELPADRIVFGSYAPVFYFESAGLKLRESALDVKQLAAITHENAARFLS